MKFTVNDLNKVGIIYRDTAIRQLKSDRGEFMASIISNFFRWLPDAAYLKLLYRFKMGKPLNELRFKSIKEGK